MPSPADIPEGVSPGVPFRLDRKPRRGASPPTARIHDTASADSSQVRGAADLFLVVDHPDENVVIDLVERPPIALISELDRHFLDDVRDRLWARAVSEATQEGLLWTPLIDVIAGADFWPFIDAGPQLDIFTSWIDGRTDPAQLWPLVESLCFEVRAVALHRLYLLDPSAAIELLASDATRWRLLYRANDPSPEIHLPPLERWATDVILSETTAPTYRGPFPTNHGNEGIAFFVDLAVDGSLRLPALAELMQVAVPGWASSRGRRRLAHSRAPHTTRRDWAQIAIIQLAPWIPASWVDRVYAARYGDGPSDDWISTALDNPDAPLGFLRRAARTLRLDAIDAWRILCESPLIFADSVLFGHIVRRAPWRLVWRLASEAKAKAHHWPLLFQRLAAIPEAHAGLVRALQEAGQADLIGIGPRHWPSLIAGPDQCATCTTHSPYRPAILALVPKARRTAVLRRQILASNDPIVLYGLCLDADGREGMELYYRLRATDPILADRAIQYSTTLAGILPRSDLVSVLKTADETRRHHIIELICRARTGSVEAAGCR